MTSKALLLVIASVLLSAFAQILLKIGMSGNGVRTSMDGGSVLQSYMTILLQPAVLGGLVCYVLSAMVWLRVLAVLDVSKAYPFIAVGIVATMVLGVLILGETVTMLRAAGAALIVVGVVVVGFS